MSLGKRLQVKSSCIAVMTVKTYSWKSEAPSQLASFPLAGIFHILSS